MTGDHHSAYPRTDMAWVRTSLALVGLAALVARQSGSVPIAIAVLAAAVPAVALLVRYVERCQPARLAAMAAGRNVTAPGAVLALTAITVTLAVVGFVLALT